MNHYHCRFVLILFAKGLELLHVQILTGWQRFPHELTLLLSQDRRLGRKLHRFSLEISPA
jgi:hypothetical protein